jgi:hypothetical protein
MIRYFAPFLAVLFLVFIFFLTRDNVIDPSHLKETRNGSILSRDYWVKRIQADGGKSAYAFLAEQVQSYDDYGQHLTAHEFGNALYHVEGIDAVTVCDHRFGNGCFHQFFMTALDAEGDGAVKKYSEECRSKLGEKDAVHACNHGLGHGVMIANESTGLNSALNTCAQLSDPYAFHGCIDGVFMEYFTPTHLGRSEEELPQRKFSEIEPLAPCLKLSGKFQPTCYYMLASWWAKIKTFSQAAELCREVPVHRSTCFKSLGHVFTMTTSYSKEKTLSLCKEFGIVTEDEFNCRVGAHWAFSHAHEVGVVLEADEKMLCAFDEREKGERCVREADMKGTPIGISVICCDKAF